MEGGNKMKTRLGGERSFRRFALITLGIMTILSLGIPLLPSVLPVVLQKEEIFRDSQAM